MIIISNVSTFIWMTTKQLHFSLLVTVHLM